MAVHDVERALCEHEPEIRPHADRDADPVPRREGQRRPEGDEVAEPPIAVGEPAQRPPPGRQVPCACGRREHRHVVPEGTKGVRCSRNVLVHRVGLRPRERRDEADAERHRAIVGRRLSPPEPRPL